MSKPQDAVDGVETVSEGPTTRAPEAPSGNIQYAKLLERYALPLAWLGLIIFFSILMPTTFFTMENASTILASQAVIVVLTLALLIPLTAGDYDLSVAFNLSFAAMIIAVLNVNENWPIGWAVLAALVAGTLVGFVNGGVVVVFAIDPFIVTLGTGTFISGIVLWISGTNTISGISNSLVSPIIIDRFLGIPLEFYYGLVLTVLLWYFLEYTPIGRRLLIVGRGRNVARLSGLRVGRLRWGALIASGFISALAGTLYAGTLGAADPSSGPAFLLPAFAAAFLGATTIMPGRFNSWGAIIATYFLVTGITGLQLLGAQSFVQPLFYGAALVIAVAFSQIARRREALDTGTGG